MSLDALLTYLQLTLLAALFLGCLLYWWSNQ